MKLFAFSLRLCVSKIGTTPLRDACLAEKRFRPKPGTIKTDIWIRRAARSLTSQGRAEPLCARIESANREVSEGKADL